MMTLFGLLIAGLAAWLLHVAHRLAALELHVNSGEEIHRLRRRVEWLEQQLGVAYRRTRALEGGIADPEVVASPPADLVDAELPAPAPHWQPTREVPIGAFGSVDTAPPDAGAGVDSSSWRQVSVAAPHASIVEPLVARAAVVPDEMPSAPTPTRMGPSLEERIGGQWLGWLAAVTVVFTVGLFLKWAYDRGWITPLLQLPPLAYLCCGWAVGLALLAAGERLRRAMPLYAQGLSGAAIATLYLTTYAGDTLYHTLSPETATLGLILVGALAIATALRHDSAAIGWLGIVLAYVSPVLLETRGASPTSLFMYLTALNGVVLGISVLRRWVAFRAAAFAATVFLYVSWHTGHFSSLYLFQALTFVGTNSAIFLGVLALYPLIRNEATRDSDLALAVLNPLLAGITFYAILKFQHAGAMGWVAAAFAAVYYLVARAIRIRRGEQDYLEQLFYATALVFAVLAIPLQFHGRTITATWALMGAGMSAVGAVTLSSRTRFWGVAAVALALGRLLVRDLDISPGSAAFFNERAFSFASVAFGLAVVTGLSVRDWLRSGRVDARSLSIVSAGTFILCGVMDLWVWLEAPPGWLALGWSAVAGLALAYGLWLDCGPMRRLAAWYALPALGQAVVGGYSPAHPYTIAPGVVGWLPGWIGALLLFLGAAAAFQRVTKERVPERGLGTASAAAACLLLLTRSHSELPVAWVPIAWTATAAAVLAAGFLLREQGWRLVGFGVSATVVAYLVAAPGLLHRPPSDAPGFLAGILLCGAVVWAHQTRLPRGEPEADWLPVAYAAAAAAVAMAWSYHTLGPGWLPVSWALVAGALLWCGVSTGRPGIRAAGLCAAALVSGEVILREWAMQGAYLPLLHSRSAGALAAIAAWAAAILVFRRWGDSAEQRVIPALIAAVNLQALGWLSVEAMDVARHVGPGGWAREASQFALSAVWIVYAASSILVGLRRDSAEARWAGMALLLAGVVKVYLFDLGFLPLGYRVLSFLVLALVLLGISYLYQRRASIPQKEH